MNNHLIWIKQPLSVFTANDEDATNGIVIDQANGNIVELVGQGQTPQSVVSQTFDVSEHVLLPGLVNTHHHLYQTLTRAFPDAINKPLFPLLKTLYPIWAKLMP